MITKGKHYFITGTNTGVGKTHIIKLLLENLREQGIDAVGFKPVCCGDRKDAEIIAAASGGLSVDQVNPLWLKSETAPWVAAQLENKTIQAQDLLDAFHDLKKHHDVVLIEGVGGWLVPLAENFSMADFAKLLEIPAIIVVANQLGAINHTCLTAQAIQQAGVTCEGLILNHLEDELDLAMISNKSVIPKLCGAPLLAEVIHGQDWIELE